MATQFEQQQQQQQQQQRRARRGQNVRPAIEVMERRTLLAMFLVTNTADLGAGSLRQAILDSNGSGSASTITFNIPATDSHYSGGVFTITPTSPLPTLTSPVGTTLDAVSETYFDGVNNSNPNGPEVVLDGRLAGASADGIAIQSSNNQVLGLAIQGFGGRGVAILGGSNNKLEANVIGQGVTGAGTGTGNGGDGVQISGGATNSNVGAYWDQVIDYDHVDVVGVNYSNGHWSQFDQDRDLGPGLGTSLTAYKTLMEVNSNARTTMPSSSTYSFIGGTPGQQIWVLPQQQNPNLLYAGSESLAITPGTFAAYIPNDPRVPQSVAFPWLKVQVTAVHGPGQFSMWQDGNPDPTVWVSTADGLDSSDAIYIPVDGHIHYDWGFTKPGLYEIDFQVSGYLDTNRDGKLDAGDTFTQSASVPRYFGVETTSPSPSLGNTITGNGGAGISVVGNATVANVIGINSIGVNGGLPIDLGGDGPTPNHVGGSVTGPNNLTNAPVLTGQVLGATTEVTGILVGDASTAYTLSFYVNPSGQGGAQRYLGSSTTTTDASGNASFDVTLAAATATDETVVATATAPTPVAPASPRGGTSEVSRPQAVAPTTFVATSVTPTPSGFDVQLNRAPDLSSLNLYNGLADVTLIGAATGPVRGSLVVGPGNLLSFVRTGGVLVADTYTLSVRSGSDALKDTGGNLLDGNGDGTPGDNLPATFTVASSASGPVLSLPDFARGPGQPVNVPATASGLPVRLSNPAGVTSLTFLVSWNPAQLTINGAAAGANAASGATVMFTPGASGTATVTYSAGTAIRTANAALVALTASVPMGATYGSLSVVRLSSASANGGALAISGDLAVEVAAYLGDVNASRGYTGVDTTLIGRLASGTATGLSAFPTLDPRVIADISGDGAVTGVDTTLMSRRASGATVPQIPALPGTSATPSALSSSSAASTLASPVALSASRVLPTQSSSSLRPTQSPEGDAWTA